MQKLDFTENIQEIRKLLTSDSIVNFITQLPTNSPVDANPLTPLVIQSKSNFDKIASNDPKTEILNSLGAKKLYSEESIGKLINSAVYITINKFQKVQLFLDP